MRTTTRSSKSAHRGVRGARPATEAGAPVQLSLRFFTEADHSKREERSEGHLNGGNKTSAGLPHLDCVTTREVLRMVGVDRSTLYRWRIKRRFPPKHKSGGWLRSDVEKWLTEHDDKT